MKGFDDEHNVPFAGILRVTVILVDRSHMDHNQLVAIKARHREQLCAIPGVVVITVDYKRIGGRQTDQLAIVVGVTSKRDVPESDRVPALLDGAPTDVMEATVRLNVDATAYTPVQAGGSTAPRRVPYMTGTLGCLVEDGNARRTPLFLSCWHVLCYSADWNKNQDKDILQPAPADGGHNTDGVGIVIRGVVKSEDGIGPNVDCAVCTCTQVSDGTTQRPATGEIVGIGLPNGSREAQVDQLVRKRGARTLMTEGTVTQVSDDVRIHITNVGDVWFYDLIAIRPRDKVSFSEPGDSGSAIIETGTNSVVGVLIGDYALGKMNYSVASHIRTVCDALGVTVPAHPPAYSISPSNKSGIVLSALHLPGYDNAFPIERPSVLSPASYWVFRSDGTIRNVARNKFLSCFQDGAQWRVYLSDALFRWTMGEDGSIGFNAFGDQWVLRGDISAPEPSRWTLEIGIRGNPLPASDVWQYYFEVWDEPVP